MNPELDCELDAELILKRVGGRRNILHRIIDEFVSMCPKQLEIIGEAVQAADSETLARASHRLRGSASNFDAHKVVALAAELEALGRAGDRESASELFQRLSVACRFLIGRLRGLRDESG